MLRVAAVLSFGFFLVAGLLVLGMAVSSGHADALMIVAAGLCLVGVAFFAGSILLVAAEKAARKHEGR
jgi:uncharacterized membrane protein YgdD (TMEM256/DUF423 family)